MSIDLSKTGLKYKSLYPDKNFDRPAERNKINNSNPVDYIGDLHGHDHERVWEEVTGYWAGCFFFPDYPLPPEGDKYYGILNRNARICQEYEGIFGMSPDTGMTLKEIIRDIIEAKRLRY
jgi:hypothetical protein